MLEEILPKIYRINIEEQIPHLPPPNPYLLKTHGWIVLIDTGYFSPLICKAFEEIFKENKGMDYAFLLTHSHVDHYGAAGFLQRRFKAEGFIHSKDLETAMISQWSKIEKRLSSLRAYWKEFGFSEEEVSEIILKIKEFSLFLDKPIR